METKGEAIEAVARALCKRQGTAQCAAICLSYFASDTREGKCPKALRVWGSQAEGAVECIIAFVKNNPDAFKS